MKKLGLAYWTLALMLSLVHIVLLITYTSVCFSTDNRISPSAMACWAVVALSITLLSISVVVKAKQVTPWITTLRTVTPLVLAGLLGWYLIDAPPMEKDYAEKDLQIANSGGYPHLKPFYSEDKAQALQKYLEDIEHQTTETDEKPNVIQAWDRISEFRAAIEELDRFEAIYDLPDSAVVDINAPTMRFTVIKGVADVYGDFIQYQLNRGNGPEAIRYLGQLHRVARKGMTGSALLIHKIIFAALSNKTMAMAYEVLDHEHCTPDLVTIIKDDFRPLGRLECDMERVLISEYLTMKNMFSNSITADNFLAVADLKNTFKNAERKLTALVSRPLFYLLYKPNMTVAFHRKHIDLLIQGDRLQPPDYAKAQIFLESYGSQPSFRNMIGWILNNFAVPTFSRYSEKVHQKKVQSELLAWAIEIRLGNDDAKINEEASNGRYLYSESKGLLRSAGPDGLYNTKDDVTLEKPN